MDLPNGTNRTWLTARCWPAVPPRHHRPTQRYVAT